MICYPKCSTCQKAMKYLDFHHISYEVRNIKEEVPSKEELKEFLKKSSLDLHRFFNTSGMKYRQYHLKEKLPQMSEDEKLALLASDGMLIKRPLLVTEDKVYVGFKEKEWSELL